MSSKSLTYALSSKQTWKARNLEIAKDFIKKSLCQIIPSNQKMSLSLSLSLSLIENIIWQFMFLMLLPKKRAKHQQQRSLILLIFVQSCRIGYSLK